MSKSVAAIWWGMLVATVAGVVPVAVSLLARALKAARNIEQYTAEALEGGVGIAEHTANASALKETIAATPVLLGAAESLQRHTSVIAAAVAPENPSGGRSDGKGEMQP